MPKDGLRPRPITTSSICLFGPAHLRPISKPKQRSVSSLAPMGRAKDSTQGSSWSDRGEVEGEVEMDAEEEDDSKSKSPLWTAAQGSAVAPERRLPWLTGIQLLNHTNQNTHFLPTGLEGIDALLGGGLRQGQVTEIAGPSSSGKTQVCLSSATHVVDKNFGVVLYLDTSNSFSPNRISCFVNQVHPYLLKELKERRLQTIMSNIYCQSVFDIFALLDFLHHVESALKHTVKLGGSKLFLLIIDSVSSVIAPVIGGKNSQGWCMMASVGVLLKRIAHEHNIAVLVTNHMVGGENGTLKPALGESWKGVPHVRLLLSCSTGNDHGTATVLKHTLLASGRTANFVIDN